MPRSSLYTMSLVLWSLTGANFFATPNPYSAAHTGSTGLEAEQFSEHFAMNQALMIGGGLAIAWLLSSRLRVRLPACLMIGAACLLASGVATGVIELRPQSYTYDVVSMALLASLAAATPRAGGGAREMALIYIASGVLCVLGIVFAVTQPDRWGLPSFEFSRERRGEVTFAVMMGLYMLLPPLSLVADAIGKPIRVLVFLAFGGMTVATLTRSLSYLAVAPVMIYALVGIRARWIRWLSGMALVALCVLLVGSVWNEVTFSSADELLTGRLQLWKFYWDSFIEAPLFGRGANLLERASSYRGEATSEIGVLKSFAEFGIGWSVAQLWLVIVACRGAIRSLRQESERWGDALLAYCSIVVLTTAPLFLVEGFTRVLSVSEAIFWYSVFYLQKVKLPSTAGSRVDLSARFEGPASEWVSAGG
jgi:O-Antigen ligase